MKIRVASRQLIERVRGYIIPAIVRAARDAKYEKAKTLVDETSGSPLSQKPVIVVIVVMS